jgi:hypothetical protein
VPLVSSLNVFRGHVIALAAAAAASAAAAPAAIAPVSAQAKAGPLTISPQPGTPDASPATQISILGAAPREIRSVTVTGSLSGAHAGVLRPYSANRGASFVLRNPLAEG